MPVETVTELFRLGPEPVQMLVEIRDPFFRVEIHHFLEIAHRSILHRAMIAGDAAAHKPFVAEAICEGSAFL